MNRPLHDRESGPATPSAGRLRPAGAPPPQAVAIAAITCTGSRDADTAI